MKVIVQKEIHDLKVSPKPDHASAEYESHVVDFSFIQTFMGRSENRDFFSFKHDRTEPESAVHRGISNTGTRAYRGESEGS